MRAALYDVAVMHDFFIDRLVMHRGIKDLFRIASSKARQGGGSVHGIVQEDVRGGNAVNLAHALARLGNKVLLITHSDAAHSGMLRQAVSGTDLEFRIKRLPPGLTLSLEGDVNVMLSDSRGAADFPPTLLTQSDWNALRSSKVVCSVNWSSNRHGTALLRALRGHLGRDRTIFFNPSDVRDRSREYGQLVRGFKTRRLVDWVSLNEYEAETTAKALGIASRSPARACSSIAQVLKMRVDVHTEWTSHTSDGGRVTSAKTKHVFPRRLTGAGDVWDAASITGSLKGMDDKDRLEFANSAARLYVKSRRLSPPTLREVRSGL